jgi:hypothetical protein
MEKETDENIQGKKYVGTNIDTADYDELNQLADKQDRSISNVIRIALREYIKNMKVEA